MSQYTRSAFCARLVLSFVFVCAPKVRAHGQEFYFTTIDFPGARQTFAFGVNPGGKIGGSYYDSNNNDTVSRGLVSHGFVDSGGRFTTIDFPGARQTFAFGVNASGQIVGYYYDSNNNSHGFVDSGGRFTTIDFPGAGQTYAFGINASGQIVGGYCESVGQNCHGFLDSGGRFTTIDFPGAAGTSANGINASGQIVGAYSDSNSSYGFLYSGGQFTTIAFPGADATVAFGINASEQIVGYYETLNGTQGFLDSGGQFTTIDFPGGGRDTYAVGINDEEQIVGSSGNTGFLANPCSTTSRNHPAIFYGVRPDGSMETINWSGYAVTGSSFTSAKGSWTVPSVNCRQTPNSYSSFWVGIDGYGQGSSTVEQTGTDSLCNGSSAEYDAWFEFAPNPSHTITSVPVAPGNVISASVHYNGDSLFTTTITNETTGKSYSTPPTTVPGAERSSAEWIAEAPCTPSGGIQPLSDFGIAYFGQDYTNVSGTNDATDSSTSGPIGAFGSNVTKIIMVDPSDKDKAVPSSLTPDGTSFDVVWDREN